MNPRAFILLTGVLALVAKPQTADIKVNTTLVVIPVTVTDSLHRFVLGLEPSDFKILEDGKEQKVTHFSAEDAPLSVGILLDTSGSMGAKVNTAQQAVRDLLKSLNSGDQAFLIEFNDRARLVEGLTADPEMIARGLNSLKGGGLTALLDAVNLGLDEMKKANNPRKALVIISDGGDNNSRYTQAQIKGLVREADVQIYAMGVFEPSLFPSLTKEEVSGPRLLSQVSEQSGGRAFGASDVGQLPAIAEKIAVELHNEYILAFSPSNSARDGSYRKIQVIVKQPNGLPDLTARWRLGYYSPAE